MTSLAVALLCLVSFGVASAQPVKDQWAAVGENTWASQRFLQGGQDLSQLKGYNSFGSIIAYSGGAFDPGADTFRACATGGHGDYPGNECYAFDLTTALWSREFNPTVDLIVTGGGVGPPQRSPDPLVDTSNAYPTNANLNSLGQRAYPAARHTYGGELWMDSVRQVLIVGGIVTDGSGYYSREVYWYDPATRRYTHMPGDNLQTVVGATYQHDLNGVWDSLRNVALFHDGLHTFTYDPSKPEGARFTRGYDAAVDWGSTQMAAAFVKPLGRMVLMGARNSNDGASSGGWYIDTLVPGGPPTYQRRDIVFTGPGAADMLARWWGTDTGLLYDPIIGKLIFWPAAGRKFYQIDPSTWSVVAVEWTGGEVPHLMGGSSIYGRFFYSPKRDAYVLINDVYGPVMEYRPTRTQVQLEHGIFHSRALAWQPQVVQRPGKHVVMTRSPQDGRIYAVGGDYFDGSSATQSYRQSMYSLDIGAFLTSNDGATGWRREYDECGAGLRAPLQPKMPDFVGLTWVPKWGQFLFVPGTSVSRVPECAGETDRGDDLNFKFAHLMAYDPAVKQWTDLGSDPTALGNDGAWQSHYDPVTDRVFKPNGLPGGPGVSVSPVLPAAPAPLGAWTNLANVCNTGNGGFSGSNQSLDVVGRMLYMIDNTAPGRSRMFAFNLDTWACAQVADPPDGGQPGNSTSNFSVSTWDTANRVLLYYSVASTAFWNSMWQYNPALDARAGDGSDPTGAWMRVPITTSPANTPPWALQIRYASYDAGQNVHVFAGNTTIDPTTGPLYLFVYRVAVGGASPPTPPPLMPPSNLTVR